MEWETLCRRTEDPKLAFIEYRLTQEGIEHRRNGESAHAPILEVPAAKLDAAWAILGEQTEAPDGDLVPLDDLDDYDRYFYADDPEAYDCEDGEGWWRYRPHDWLPGDPRPLLNDYGHPLAS